MHIQLAESMEKAAKHTKRLEQQLRAAEAEAEAARAETQRLQTQCAESEEELLLIPILEAEIAASQQV